jgi:hypothetical protein
VSTLTVLMAATPTPSGNRTAMLSALNSPTARVRRARVSFPPQFGSHEAQHQRGPSRLDEEDHVIDVETPPALISVPRAAELLRLSRASAYRFAASGDLLARHLGGSVYVVTSRLVAFINGDGEAA